MDAEIKYLEPLDNGDDDCGLAELQHDYERLWARKHGYNAVVELVDKSELLDAIKKLLFMSDTDARQTETRQQTTKESKPTQTARANKATTARLVDETRHFTPKITIFD